MSTQTNHQTTVVGPAAASERTCSVEECGSEPLQQLLSRTRNSRGCDVKS